MTRGVEALPVSIQNITPQCRANRGNLPAFDEAHRRIFAAYMEYVGEPANSGITWRLTLSRVE